MAATAPSAGIPYALACDPFSIAPDPRFLYLSPHHQAALDTLMRGLRSGGGLVLLTGDIGAGKTTVWRAFLQQRPGDLDVATISNPKLSAQALLRRICSELQVAYTEPPPGSGEPDLIDALHGHLLLAHAMGRRSLIVLDEAQSLSFDALEQLRLLTNLVTDERKLVQIWLIGQPELRAMLAMPEMASVSQRVVARYHLPALSLDDTGYYLAHRLSVAGYEGEPLFSVAAVHAIHARCEGTPRRINVLCERALALAYQAGAPCVETLHVKQAAKSVFDDPAQAALLPGAPRPQARTRPATWTHHPATARLRRWGQGLRRTGVWVAAAGLSGAVLLAIVFGHPPAGQGPTEKPRLLSTAPAATPPAPDMALNSVVAAATTLPASAPQAAEPPVAPGDTSALFEAPVANEAQAWQQLAKLWGWTLNSADPCAQAPAQGAACYTSTRGLGPIRLLNRPGWLTLHDEQGRSARPLLLGLNADHAWLQDARGRMHRVPLARLAWLWRGDFATLWRLPAGQPPVNPLPDTGPAADALAARLATLDGSPSTAADPARWHARILAFQLQQGLPADGEAGPMTLMRLNQLSGVREPTLASGKPSGAR